MVHAESVLLQKFVSLLSPSSSLGKSLSSHPLPYWWRLNNKSLHAKRVIFSIALYNVRQLYMYTEL